MAATRSSAMNFQELYERRNELIIDHIVYVTLGGLMQEGQRRARVTMITLNESTDMVTLAVSEGAIWDQKALRFIPDPDFLTLELPGKGVTIRVSPSFTIVIGCRDGMILAISSNTDYEEENQPLRDPD